MVFAVESALMCNVVGWANYTSSMDAFEAALVVRSSIHGNLLKENKFPLSIIGVVKATPHLATA